MMSGRYPEKTAGEFLKLLDNLESNAEYKGMDMDRLGIIQCNITQRCCNQEIYS